MREHRTTTRWSELEFDALRDISGGNVSAFIRQLVQLHTGGTSAIKTISKEISFIDSVIHDEEEKVLKLRGRKGLLEARLRTLMERKDLYIEHRQTLLEHYVRHFERGKERPWDRQFQRTPEQTFKAWLEGHPDMIIDADFDTIKEAIEWCKKNVSR